MMTLTATSTSSNRAFAQDQLHRPAQATMSRGLTRYVLTFVQLAVLLPLAPAILLAWAVYWCVDGESLDQLNKPSAPSPNNCFQMKASYTETPQIGLF